MIKNNKQSLKMHSTYYLKPGQTLENTKIADRRLALLVTKGAFDRFVDYTTENERLAAAAEEEKARLDALRKQKADENLEFKKRRRDELSNRKKLNDEARAQFVKEAAARNAVERAKIVNEARKLLLWKKPQCRLINGALLTAESYRQLNAQMAFQKTLRTIDEEREAEYARMIKSDVERSTEEEKIKNEEQLKKNIDYGTQLKKQIEDLNSDSKRLELQELTLEKEDLINMAKEMRLVDECEAEQTAKRKKELRDMFVEALEKKKLREMEIERKNELENRALEIFEKSKDRIKQIGKLRTKEAREQKLKRSELMAKKCAAARHSREAEEEEIIRKSAEQKEALEREKLEAKKKYEEKVRSDLEKYRAELAATKERRANEAKDLINWETLQRFKRDEYNKEIILEKSERERTKKLETANFLRKQIAEREAERKHRDLMDDDAAQIKANIERTNEKVLAYGEQVLNECKALNEANPNGPIRPLFPIKKVIQEFKKECGMLPPKVHEICPPPKRRLRRKKVCSKPAEQICYI